MIKMDTLKEQIWDELLDIADKDGDHEDQVDAVIEVIQSRIDQIQLPIVNKDTLENRILENPNAKSE